MFADLEEFLDGRCQLRVGGRTYQVQEPNAKEGLRLQTLFADPENTLSSERELGEIMKLLGPVWDELEQNGVGQTKATFVGRVALIYYAINPASAIKYASGGVDDPGNPLPPARKTFWGKSIRPSLVLTEHGIPVAVHGSKRLTRASGSTTSP